MCLVFFFFHFRLLVLQSICRLLHGTLLRKGHQRTFQCAPNMKPATDHRDYCSFALLQPLFQHLNRSTFLFLNKHLYFYEFSQAILCFISLSSSYTYTHTNQRRETHPHTKNFNCVRQRPTKFIMDMNVAFHSNLLLYSYSFTFSFFLLLFSFLCH